MPRNLMVSLAGLFFLLSSVFAHQEPGLEGLEDLQLAIQKILDEEKVPGASVALVSRDRTLWAGGVGKSDVAAGKDVTADSLFRVGSISKSFTALAVLMLVEQGLVDLDTPVREIVPEVEFTNPWEATDPVRVAHLMEHTAGFDDIHPREYAYVDNPKITLLEGLNFNPNSRISRWKPGRHMSYCNSGPAIAAYIVEKVTGQVFEDFVRNRIFDALGMKNSSFHYPKKAELMAKGYKGDGVTEANYDHIIVRPAGALNTSSKEMANFIRMLINRGTFHETTLVQPATIDRMETPQTTLSAKAGFSLGYSLGNYVSFVNGFVFHGHNGGITGFSSSYAYSSDLGVGYFVSVNKPGAATTKIGTALGKFLTKGKPKPSPETAQLSADELRRITGYYELITPRQQIQHVVGRFFSIQRVTVEDGKLIVKPFTGGRSRELIPVTANSFRFENQPVASLYNVTNKAGEVIAQWGPMGNLKKVSLAWVLLQWGAGVLSVLLMATSVIFALYWIPMKLLRKMSDVSSLQVRVLPLLAVMSLCIGLAPFFLSSNFVADFGGITLYSSLVFLGMLLFALFTILALYTSYRSFSQSLSRAVRWHSLLVTLACTAVLLYLWNNGVIGLRLWAY